MTSDIVEKIYAPAVQLAELVDKPLDQAVYMIASFTTLFISLILYRIKGEKRKKTFSMLTGLTINFYVFGLGSFASLSQNIISFAIMKLWSKDSQHIAVFVISATCLSVAQLHKQITRPGENGLDMPMNLMFNFCRVTSLACCIRDGDKIKEFGPEKHDLKKRELKYAIKDRDISFLSFMSYMYFCGGAISGPWFEYLDFDNYCKGKGHYANIPNTFWPALSRFCQAWCYVGVSIVLSQWTHDKIYIEPQFLDLSFPWKCVYMYITLKLIMSTYQCGFCLMEVGGIASGLSYMGEEEKDKFGLIRCIGCYALEVSAKAKDFLANWNISTHLWLKNYVYLRMMPTNKRGYQNQAALMTFIVSAIWHGFYPGFMHFFFWLGILEYNAKLCSEVLAPKVRFIPDLIQEVIIYVWCYFFCGYLALSFAMLQFEYFHKTYLSMGYAGHIVLVCSIVSLRLVRYFEMHGKASAKPDNKKLK